MVYLITFALVTAAVGGISPHVPPLTARTLITPAATRRQAWRGYGLLLAAIAPLILLSALREGIGTDYYYTYVPRFAEIAAGERTYYEIGFYALNRAVALFTDNPQWLIAVTATIFGVCIFSVWYKQAEDLPFCVLWLLASGEYFISLNNVRQSLAAAVLLCGVGLLQRRRYLWFALLTAAAATLHQSLLVGYAVLALAVAAAYLPRRPLTIGIAALGGVTVAVLHLFPHTVAALLPDRFAQYIAEGMYLTPTIGRLRTIINIALLALMLYTQRRTRTNRLDLFILIQIAAVAVCLADGTIPAAYRILRLFSVWQLVSVPLTAECYIGRDRRRAQAAVLLVGGALTLYAVGLRGDEAVLPYRWIFSH